MSYNIQYNSDMNKKYPKNRLRKQLPIKKIVIVSAICVVAYIFTHNGWYKFLLPGDPDVTASALSSLVDNVSDGVSVKNAVYAFCEDIITASNIQ